MFLCYKTRSNFQLNNLTNNLYSLLYRKKIP